MRKFFWGAVFGGIAGSLAALLYTKRTGEETREELSRRYRLAKDSSEKLFDDLAVAKKDLVKKAKEFADDAKITADRILKDSKKNDRPHKKGRSQRAKRR